MFEKAVRAKYRFPFARGQASVEDLWDLTLPELDSIFKTLNRQVKAATEETLLTTKSAADDEILAKIEIVKYIVATLQAEAEFKAAAKKRSESKQELLELLNRKEHQAKENLSVDEIKALIAGLG